jgi:hypothetical protein
MEQIECSETSAYKIQKPGNHPEENIQHTEHGGSLKSKICKFVWFLFAICVYGFDGLLFFLFILFFLCGVFNLVPSYCMVETNYNTIIVMVGLLVMSIFGGGSLIWLICPTFSVICMSYLRFLTLFVVLLGG